MKVWTTAGETPRLSLGNHFERATRGNQDVLGGAVAQFAYITSSQNLRLRSARYNSPRI